MNKAHAKEGANPFWKFFSSIKLTIVILILLAIVSIIGTVVPQNDGARVFAERLGPQTLRLFTALNLFDMYHALWFRIIIACLAVNLVVCSIDRFPSAWKKFKLRPDPDRTKPFENLPEEQSFVTDREFEAVADDAGRLLRSRFKGTSEKEAKGGRYFYAEKGRLSHFGVYIVHLSVLLILVGSLIGSFFGFNAYVNIVEGEETDHAMIRKEMRPLDLGFSVRCDQFTVDFYETGAPREFRSVLSFIADGKEVKKADLLVNHPVVFRGITFYQASYGSVPGKAVDLEIFVEGKPAESRSIQVETEKEYPLPGGKGTFEVVDVRSDIMRLGPAALVLIKPESGKPHEFWIFEHHEMVMKSLPAPMVGSPKFNRSSFKPYTFSLKKIQTKYYTGLQVNRDPGVSTVWAGCFLLIAGLFVTFFQSHVRIWVRVEKTKRGTEVRVAGTASKNPVGLEREIENLVDRMKSLS